MSVINFCKTGSLAHCDPFGYHLMVSEDAAIVARHFHLCSQPPYGAFELGRRGCGKEIALVVSSVPMRKSNAQSQFASASARRWLQR